MTDRNGKLHLISSYNISIYGEILYYTYPFISVPFLYKTRDLREVAFILSTHHNFNNKDLQQEGVLRETLSAYKKNKILSSPLTTYLAQEQSIEQSLNKSGGWKLDLMYQQYYPWQGVIYQDLQLNLSKKTSYQAVLANARQQANTASKNLQRVTQQLATQQKATRGGGLNAATIAAGLSDFIVESAQEELNMNFLARMRDQITNNYPEFQILFPNTIERFTDFQVTQYRSFLGNSKLAFEADLNNIGFSFPALFTDERTRKKYAVLADDPNVYNISLVYDIANKVYEETPIDSVFLHLYTRLDDRLDNLDKRVIQTMSGQLVQSKEGKTEVAYLKEESQRIFNEIDDFDLLIQIESENMRNVVDSLRKKDKEIGKKVGDAYATSNKKKYSNQYDPSVSYLDLRSRLDSNTVQTLYSYAPYGDIIPSTELPDSLRSAYRKMGKNFILQLNPSPTLDSLSDENIIRYGDEQAVTSNKLKQYEAVIHTSLDGNIRYDYKLRNLPYEQFDDYFKTVPTDSMMLLEGLFLLDDFLKKDQLTIRRAWFKNYSDFLESNLSTLKERQRNQLQTINPYPDELARFRQLTNQRREIDAILYNRVIDLQQKAKTFKLLEGLYQTLDKNYAALAKAYERAKEEGKSREQLDRIIEKQLDRDKNYLQDYVAQQTRNLYEEEANSLIEESDKMLENITLRYQQLQLKENNTYFRSQEQELEANIQAINRFFEIRFDKIETDCFQKQEKFKDQKLRSTLLKQYKDGVYAQAHKRFDNLEVNITVQADSAEFYMLQRKLESEEAVFDENLSRAFKKLEEEIETLDRLEWQTREDAEEIVEKRILSLENRLDQKNLASQIKLQRIIRKEQKSIDHIIDRRFNNLKRRLLKDPKGRLSGRKTAALDLQKETVKNLLQNKIDQINATLIENEAGVDRSRTLIHAAQSLEYLRLKFQELYSTGNGRSKNRDQEINDGLWNVLHSFNPTNLYTINDEEIEAIKEKASVQEELINKTIGVLTQLEIEYGAEENKHRYIPTPGLVSSKKS